MSKVPFIYREFWDVPRMIVCKVDQTEVLLDSEFDESIDDYTPQYKVYTLPAGLKPELLKSWVDLPSKASAYVGKIAVSAIEFDSTKRKEIEIMPLAPLLKG
jgi:hypothetical protein